MNIFLKCQISIFFFNIHTVTEIGNYGLRLEFESWSPLEVSDDTGGEGLEISFLGK
jgi:hypothetical protein